MDGTIQRLGDAAEIHRAPGWPMTDTSTSPDHVEQTIEAVAELQREHHRRATPSQKAVVQLTALVGRPRFILALTTALVFWVGLNAAGRLAGYAVPDPPPFNYLQAAAGVASVYVALLILITQRHENQLAEAGDQLALELAILNEQKSAKVIALLEEMRRDLPTLPNRSDQEAEALAQPADPQAVLQALRTTPNEIRETFPDGQPPAEA
jgi:uncharacterized membrane protein